MKFVKALRTAWKFGKVGGGLGAVAITTIELLDGGRDKDPANAAAVGMAFGAVLGGGVGITCSLIDDRFEVVRR